jgi:uncharacterized membrane protein YciS (DUF1049 family)
MFILKYLPAWLFYITMFIGIFGYLFSGKLNKYKPIFIALIFASTFMIGVISNNNYWLQKISELEVEIARLETKSEKVNTQIVTKIVTKEKIVKEAADVQIQYIDREIVKYNDQCKIPPEVISIHNKAATQ